MAHVARLVAPLFAAAVLSTSAALVSPSGPAVADDAADAPTLTSAEIVLLGSGGHRVTAVGTDRPGDVVVLQDRPTLKRPWTTLARGRADRSGDFHLSGRVDARFRRFTRVCTATAGGLVCSPGERPHHRQRIGRVTVLEQPAAFPDAQTTSIDFRVNRWLGGQPVALEYRASAADPWHSSPNGTAPIGDRTGVLDVGPIPGAGPTLEVRVMVAGVSAEVTSATSSAWTVRNGGSAD